MNNTLIAQTLGLPSALDDASTGGRNGSAVALKRAVIYLRVSTPRQARKNGEAVVRSLTQMGLPSERLRMNSANSRDVRNTEVHIYIQ